MQKSVDRPNPAEFLATTAVSGTNIYALPSNPRQASPVTLYSQQVRALNLVWALRETRQLNASDEVLVVGGGAGGATAAAAAALCGAQVRLLETAEELLHLQRGCHTRYLHPRIFDWPEHPYRHARAHLPILDWSVGTAHEVADSILSDFFRIQAALGDGQHGKGRLFASTRVRVAIGDGSNPSWFDIGTGESLGSCSPRIVILAIGFGVERTLPGLPRRSYWRVDSLTQTALDSAASPYVVLVAGQGDGGLLDVLRAKVKDFDHGGFLDACVQALEGVRRDVADAERRVQDLENDPQAVSKRLAELYEQLPQEHLTALDAAIGRLRRDTHVVWLTDGHPWRLGAQPLNRLLVWRLVQRREIEHRPALAASVALLDATAREGFLYHVQVRSPADDEIKPLDVIPAHQVVLRIGCDGDRGKEFEQISERLSKLPREAKFAGLHESVRQEFAELARKAGARPPNTVYATEVVLRARMRAPERSEATAFVIDIWLENCPMHVQWVEYVLHPEYGGITRRAAFLSKGAEPEAGKRSNFRHWVNTEDDYWLRVRLSDGFETGAWLSECIRRTPDQPEGHEKWLASLIDAAVQRRGDDDYSARTWASCVDV